MATSITMPSTPKELKLHSPAGVEPAIFTWPNIELQKTKKDTMFIGGDEIVKTIRLVFEDYPELYQQNVCLSTCDIHSYNNMKELCDKYNKIIDTHVKLNRGTEAFSAKIQQRASSKLFRHILAQVYSRAVTDPDKLRNYEPFSPSVYGETSPDLIDSILKYVNLNEDQTFIDLGSGVGNVVLQVAALADCKHVYGIEHEEIPAKYARAMSDEFRFWMRWYGKRYSDFDLEQGDFLNHPAIDEKIREADIIFANNYVFGATVNHELKLKFMTMKDGAKIVSSREFCPESFRLNDRTKNDLGAVMHVTKPDELFGKVSWSDKCVQYYLHVIDHSKLALYYEKVHQSHTKGGKVSHSKSIDEDRSNSPQSSTSSSITRPPKAILQVKTEKIDSTQKNLTRTKMNGRKRSTRSPSHSSRGRKVRRRTRDEQIDSDDENQSENDSDFSAGESKTIKKLPSTNREFQTTLDELHDATGQYFQSNVNQRFNYPRMTKLTDENLQLNRVRDCLVEQEDEKFFQSINNYLDQFRQRLFSYFNYMKSDEYREHLKQQIDNEKELNKTLKAKVNCLESSIKILLEDAIELLKLRTSELGVEKLERPAQLITYANDISSKHKELRSKVASLEQEIAEYDRENEKLNYILSNIQTNGHRSFSLNSNSPSDNAYSTLLANMSRQTQQHEFSKSLEISLPKTSKLVSSNENGVKDNFIIEKCSRKSTEHGPVGNTLVSPIKIIKVNHHKRLSNPNNETETTVTMKKASSTTKEILSSKQLEPVQVHSVISTSNPHTTNAPVVQSVNVKSLLSASPESIMKDEDSGQGPLGQSPKKKRDFYGKSSIPPTSSTGSSPTSNHRSNRQSSSNSSPSNNKTRPSSTPACTTTTLPNPSMPDRPISIPPLKSLS